ncbi:MAG TPA: head GIN domain-containing protein, partial [Bacteroidia bacterium]|nr:head GIN domain-containing protein [Bacteroidia bacterium]
MKNKFSILGIALLIALSSNLAKAQYSEKRNVDDFTKIVIGQMQPDVILTQSDSNEVIIKTSSSKKSNEIKTTVSNGTLEISGGKPIEGTIIIRVKKLNQLEMSGTVDVKTSNQLTTDNLSIITSGTGDAIIDVSAKQIQANTMGTGDIKLSGNCDSLTAIVTGTGDIKSFSLLSKSVNANVIGSGDAKINVKNYIDANVSGTGDIIYKGNPIQRTVKIEGAGSIEQADANGKLYSDNGSDTTKIKVGNKKLIIVDKDDDNADSTSEKHFSKNNN